jgi:serine/threonine protein kinase
VEKTHLKSYHNLIKLRSGVYRGLDKTGNLVLIKSFEFNSGQSWSFQRQLEQETAILKSLSHPRIPKYFDSWQDGSIFYLVREYIEGNCLVTNKIFTEKNVINIALQLLDILVYLE